MFVHPTAEIDPTASIGTDTKVWAQTQICRGAKVGDECIVGRDVYIDRDVTIGNRVKIQTGAQIYHGAVIEDGVFVGPGVCLTNDKRPRAINPDGTLQTDSDWEVGTVHIKYGASLGTGSIILPGVEVGRFAMIAAGAVVVHDVPDYALMIGVPARMAGYVCECGSPIPTNGRQEDGLRTCPACQRTYVE